MKNKLTILTFAALAFVLFPTLSSARWTPKENGGKHPSNPGPQRVLVLDGSNVHNVGELHMHVGNWGNFGSWPGQGFPFSDQPSAQWPAGSGIEYLFTSGLWIGALKSGVPAVSTAAFQTEFRPTQDPLDIIYRSGEGGRGGNRLPSPDADDDKDGVIDEDWLNGHDDDGDGLIDEDYAAVANQMFSCWYTDDQPIALQIFTQHNPLNLLIRQESYQWEEDRFDDFVGIEFKIENIGTDILQDLFLGFFADCDAGPRDRDNYWEDDGTARDFVDVACTDLGPVQIDYAFTYDVDGDEGVTPGYFGVMFLGHTTDPTGELAPQRVGISTYANFSGQQSFEEGGDPTNDFERYELLSQQSIERAATVPRDYRMLVSAGPFAELLPGEDLIFQVAFVAGARRGGSRANAASAQLTYDGAWFNLDIDAETGVAGRETPVVGPAENVFVDTCAADLPVPIPIVPRGTTIYINNDCAKEELFMMRCGLSSADSARYVTGIGGNEAQINWIVGTAPPPPSMRIVDHTDGGVVVYWDNFSETVADVKTQKFDFEGYRFWRADNWDRPLGSSQDNGPSNDLWKLLFQADVINGLGDDGGLSQYRYEPLNGTFSASKKRDLVNSIKEYLIENPGTVAEDVPMPQGVDGEASDTLQALARWELGITGGRQYYRYVDRSIHLGRPYFYAVTAMDHNEESGVLSEGKAGDPSSNFEFVEPRSSAQEEFAYTEGAIYVVPNPATKASMEAWALQPNQDDPTGIKVEFRNLPKSRGNIRVYTISGDLIIEIPFDASTGMGSVEWDLVSRNGQEVTSGVYIYAVETDNKVFDRFISKFVVVR